MSVSYHFHTNHLAFSSLSIVHHNFFDQVRVLLLVQAGQWAYDNKETVEAAGQFASENRELVQRAGTAAYDNRDTLYNNRDTIQKGAKWAGENPQQAKSLANTAAVLHGAGGVGSLDGFDDIFGSSTPAPSKATASTARSNPSSVYGGASGGGGGGGGGYGSNSIASPPHQQERSFDYGASKSALSSQTTSTYSATYGVHGTSANSNTTSSTKRGYDMSYLEEDPMYSNQFAEVGLTDDGFNTGGGGYGSGSSSYASTTSTGYGDGYGSMSTESSCNTTTTTSAAFSSGGDTALAALQHDPNAEASYKIVFVGSKGTYVRSCLLKSSFSFVG